MGAHDIIHASVAATGSLHGGPARLRYIRWTGGSAGGDITITDGGASGTTRLVVTVVTSSQDDYIDIPGDGILFSTDIYVTIDTNTAAVVDCFIEG